MRGFNAFVRSAVRVPALAPPRARPRGALLACRAGRARAGRGFVEPVPIRARIVDPAWGIKLTARTTFPSLLVRVHQYWN